MLRRNGPVVKSVESVLRLEGSLWGERFVEEVDGSVVFTRLRQCAAHPAHASLGPPESTSQMASPSLQPFLHSSWQRVPILYNGPPLSSSKLPLPMGIWTAI